MIQAVATAPEGAVPISSEVLEALEAPFDKHYQSDEVNNGLPWLSVAQVAHRLNEVLGIGGWTHRVAANAVTGELLEGYDPDTDEVWCYGRMDGRLPDGSTFIRYAYGAVKVKRKRGTADRQGEPINLRDEYKAAQSDSLKKNAQQIGVGAYLADREIAQVVGAETKAQRQQARTRQQQQAAATTTTRAADLVCQACGAELDVVRFKDNTTWSAAELARRTKEKHNKVLCMECHKQANAEKAAAVGSRIPALRQGFPRDPAEGG